MVLTSTACDVAAFKNRQPITAAKFINKNSLFVQLFGVIRQLELKLNSEQKVENIFVAPPYRNRLLAAVYFFLEVSAFQMSIIFFHEPSISFLHTVTDLLNSVIGLSKVSLTVI